jgi:hypothetical protein
MSPTLLIADDEPLLARVLESELKALWPEAQIVAVVHDGVAALEATRDQQPDVAFPRYPDAGNEWHGRGSRADRIRPAAAGGVRHRL